MTLTMTNSSFLAAPHLALDISRRSSHQPVTDLRGLDRAFGKAVHVHEDAINMHYE